MFVFLNLLMQLVSMILNTLVLVSKKEFDMLPSEYIERFIQNV